MSAGNLPADITALAAEFRGVHRGDWNTEPLTATECRRRF
jgi:hypothetical protein